MMIEQMVASEWKKYAPQVSESIQLLPFYDSHTLARQLFRKKVGENGGGSYVIYRGRMPSLFVLLEKGEVTNLLIKDSLKISWTNIFAMIENLFKQSFQSEILFNFSRSLTLHLQEVFIQQGYTIQQENRVSKKLVETSPFGQKFHRKYTNSQGIFYESFLWFPDNPA